MAAEKSRKKQLVAKRCPAKSISPGMTAKSIKNGEEITPHADPNQLMYFVFFFPENNEGAMIQKGFNEIAAIVQAIINIILGIVLSAPLEAEETKPK